MANKKGRGGHKLSVRLIRLMNFISHTRAHAHTQACTHTNFLARMTGNIGK